MTDDPPIDETAMQNIMQRLVDPWHKTFARDVIELYLKLANPTPDTSLVEKILLAMEQANASDVNSTLIPDGYTMRVLAEAAIKALGGAHPTPDRANVVMEALKEGRYAAEQGGFTAIAKQIHEAMFALSALMGDASTRKDEDGSATIAPAETATVPSHPSPEPLKVNIPTMCSRCGHRFDVTTNAACSKSLVEKLEALIKDGTPGGQYVSGFDDGVQSAIAIARQHEAGSSCARPQSDRGESWCIEHYPNRCQCNQQREIRDTYIADMPALTKRIYEICTGKGPIEEGTIAERIDRLLAPYLHQQVPNAGETLSSDGKGCESTALEAGSLAPGNGEISIAELNQFWLDAQRDDLFDVIVPSDVRRLLSEISRLRTTEPVDMAVIAHQLELNFPQISLSALSEIIEYFRPYLRTPVPVTVSLEKCAQEGMAACQNFYNTWDGKDAMAVHKHVAKAVLEAAGVKYE